MKRSEINNIIIEAKHFLERMNWKLPRWAFWSPEDWKGKGAECREIIDNMLGWDITDFGCNSYTDRGLFLFTLRNGNSGLQGGKPYAEKILIVKEDQETPFHFHWHKMEDIINRGGGNLCIELYNATENEQFGDTPVQVKIDGIEKTVAPGGKVVLQPGESICLTQRLYHRFYGEAGSGTVLIGEVSMTNDDQRDNRFYETLGRFPGIEEDEKPVHLLVSDYSNYL